MSRVVRIRRSKGQVVQDCDVYIGRACTHGGWNLPQSKWHNPFSMYKYGSFAIVRYEQYIRARPDLLKDLPELKGKVLGCWCKETPESVCHGDVLLKLLQETELTKEEEKKKTE
jgi:Domain of unknown function (DUF4326)